MRSLPFAAGDETSLDSAARALRRAFRPAGRDDLSLIARVPSTSWVADLERSCTREFAEVDKRVNALRRALERLSSRAWQIIDGAEIAAQMELLPAIEADEEAWEHDPSQSLQIRWAFELIVDQAEMIERTLSLAPQLLPTGDERGTQAFAEALGDSFYALTGKPPTRRYDAYESVERGPFHDFVVAMRDAFRHPASAATLAKAAIGSRRKRQRLMDGQRPK